MSVWVEETGVKAWSWSYETPSDKTNAWDLKQLVREDERGRDRHFLVTWVISYMRWEHKDSLSRPVTGSFAF